ncbi:MAG: L-2-amino-thiazoline-4-carboxylic acid hydrolase [Eubacterium sp.]|jgi:hypothetical protein|nr:L-2-amino-thiazoline-4-carboxylic acid hydrolase [Eubacterium sp.]
MDKQTEVLCSIEHHATLFALLAKYAIEICHEDGKNAVINGVTRYGEERGQRMARRALQNGDELNLVNCQAYGEWRAKQGEMAGGVSKAEPALVTYYNKCAWCEAWKKHGLLEYGKYYCVTIDDAVFHGFRKDFSVRTISNLSWGAESCEFDWGIPMSDKDYELLTEKRAQLGDSCIRDFNYHTAHLFKTVGRILSEQLGVKGLEAVHKALKTFGDIFGTDYVKAIKTGFKD